MQRQLLVGQNLGAKQIERAEKSVYTTARYNVIFMAAIMVITLVLENTSFHFLQMTKWLEQSLLKHYKL
jgi:Na+-driven multidrug efflux pump